MQTPDLDGAARLVVTPQRGALLAGHDNVLHVLVQVQGPAAPANLAQRPPYHLALVVDRSGSMSGQPLQEAVACARYMVDRLRGEDTAAIVAFDNRVQVLAASTPVRERQRLHAALDAIQEGGNTNLHGGWLAGAEAISGLADGVGLNRVILLSDGNANEGLTDVHAIAEQCAKLAAAGVTTSTYGLGGSFNEDLMVQMGVQGQGSHYYGQTAQDLFEPFDQEFSLLANLWARHTTLRLLPAPGVRVKMLNDYVALEPGEGEFRWRLPDVAYGSEAWALLEVTIAGPGIGAGAVPLCTVRADVVSMDGERVELGAPALALAAVGAGAFEAVAPNELVGRRLAELQASQLLREARSASHHNDWRRVDALLLEAQQRFGSNPWVAAVVMELFLLEILAASGRTGRDARHGRRVRQARLPAPQARRGAGRVRASQTRRWLPTVRRPCAA